MASTGDFSDFTYVSGILKRLNKQQLIYDDG